MAGRLGAAVVLAALLGGCVDLSVPELEGDGGVLRGATQVELLSPDAQAVQATLTTVRLRIQDVNGVRAVTLACGPVVLATWLADEATEVAFERRVDLAPCRPEDAPAGGGVVAVPLTLQTEDGTGVRQQHGPFPLQVLFPAAGTPEGAGPSLALEHPMRVGSGQPLAVRVRASEPLAAAPAVTVDGLVAAVQPEGAADGGVASVWVAQLPQGVALQPDGGAAATDVFSNERAVQVRATAQGAGGTPGQTASALVVSRVQWERLLPGRLYVDSGRAGLDERRAAHPLLTDAGIYLPLERQDVSGTWLPTFVDARTGALRGLPPEVTARPDWQARGLDARGRVLFLDTFAARAERRTLTDPLDGGTPVFVEDVVPGLVRYGDSLCTQRTLAAPDAGTCPAPTTPSTVELACLGEDGRLAPVLSTPAALGLWRPAASPFGTGGAVIATRFNFASDDAASCCVDCSSSVAWGGPGGLHWTSGLRDEFAGENFSRVLPDGEGNFALVVHGPSSEGAVAAGTTARPPVLALPPPWGAFQPVARTVLLSADGGVSTLDAGVPDLDVRQVLGVAPGGTVVLVEAGAEATRVSAWRPGQATPVWSAPLPGNFVPTLGGSEDDPGDQAFFAADGSGVAVMERAGTTGAWVLGFGPGLQTRWAYRHLDSGAVRIFPSPDGRAVLVVDSDNAVVLSLAR